MLLFPCCVGAVSVSVALALASDVIQTAFVGTTFDSNINVIAGVDPASGDAYNTGGGLGGSDPALTRDSTGTL